MIYRVSSINYVVTNSKRMAKCFGELRLLIDYRFFPKSNQQRPTTIFGSRNGGRLSGYDRILIGVPLIIISQTHVSAAVSAARWLLSGSRRRSGRCPAAASPLGRLATMAASGMIAGARPATGTSASAGTYSVPYCRYPK